MPDTPENVQPGDATGPPPPEPAAAKLGIPEGLGWPFAQMFAAALAVDEAANRERAARVAEDVNAREQAIYDQMIARSNWQKVRDDLVAIVVGGLRIALQDDPFVLIALLDDVVAKLPTIARMISNDNEVAGAVAAIENRRPGRGAA
jgi:hypothetical protein